MRKIREHLKKFPARLLKPFFGRTEADVPRRWYTRDHLKKQIKAGLVSVWPHSYGKITIHGNISRLRIGDYRSIAKGCEVFLGNDHRLERCTTYPFCVASRLKIRDWKAGHITGSPTSKRATLS